MKRLLLALLLTAASAPAPAQHEHHSAPAAPATESDPPAGHRSTAPRQHEGHGEPVQDPHAGHAATAVPGEDDPHAGHDMNQTQDPHAGHGMAPAPTVQDPHAGHHMDAAPQPPAPPVGPPPPEALTGPDHAADAFHGSAAMAAAREEMRTEHGAHITWGLFADQLEIGIRDGGETFSWADVQLRYGNDIDRLWIKTEGEAVFGDGIEQAEVQALWSHALDPWLDLQAGVRQDFAPDPDRTYLVLGIQGLAPYWFEIDATAFVSTKGDVSARLEAEYDQRITQRLILQPRIEAELALQDVPELGIGAGLSAAELGLRLRYEIAPEFAPYVGVQYERAFGDTARFARSAGEDVGGWSVLAGVRIWF
jgi:copper resistance protein B